ncbi:uncharacterized protein LOC112449858 [Kryptolebias marmoratus]|uniref:uncharacterized protein LOC112449858 n=1 Tax=Kryptolebias marmoratus TaxID=37003 RepID=UPI000D52FFB3|nr:uncharacterized protein LOC112449858 [Kryptolebias marmoratus]
MSTNSSSSLSVLPPLSSSSNSSTLPFYLTCQQSVPRRVIFSAYVVINACLLPLFLLILLMGLQWWRSRRSAGTKMSHSDFFTYNMMVPEIICVVGSVVFVLGSNSNKELLVLLGLFMFCIILPGQTLFHVLTCVDRYLAVVHPVPYMHRKDTLGVRIRTISTVCVWLLSALWVGIMKLYLPDFPTIPFFCFLGVCIWIIFFCCLSVLCALTRPGPGGAEDHRGQVDQSKRRAFDLILAITVTLHLRFVGLMVSFGLKNSILINLERFCAVLGSGIFLTLPSSLVLPLLFLHRAGKLPCCRKNAGSE